MTMQLRYVERRRNIPSLVCPGCGGELWGREGEHSLLGGGRWAAITWECLNESCCYGPRALGPREMLGE